MDLHTESIYTNSFHLWILVPPIFSSCNVFLVLRSESRSYRLVKLQHDFSILSSAQLYRAVMAIVITKTYNGIISLNTSFQAGVNSKITSDLIC